jgi:signal transduction histidine kinase
MVFKSNGIEFNSRFIPIEMTILVDNFVNNAIKASSSRIEFSVVNDGKEFYLCITNNGDKFHADITSIEEIFVM